MSRTWFSTQLETVATFWRVLRRDGVTLGFITHDEDLWFDGVLHAASPGMVPSSIRRSADFEPDSAEVQGALSHDSLAESDLAGGRFDGAQVRIGLIDWQSGEMQTLYRGAIGAISEEDGRFTAELASSKAELARDIVPRTSPSCRASFCGPGCMLSAARYTHDAMLISMDLDTNSVIIDLVLAGDDYVGGSVRWLDGPQAGLVMRIMTASGARLVLDTPLDPRCGAGARLLVREGCDHTIDTCASRFANAANFQGEPFLPGNDLLTRYPLPAR